MYTHSAKSQNNEFLGQRPFATPNLNQMQAFMQQLMGTVLANQKQAFSPWETQTNQNQEFSP